MAFLTLYPTGGADFNAPRIRKVDLQDYSPSYVLHGLEIRAAPALAVLGL